MKKLLLALILLPFVTLAQDDVPAHPYIKFETTEGDIVVELKAVKDITDAHFAFVRSYLRATKKNHGLILNFAKPTLEIKRVQTKSDH